METCNVCGSAVRPDTGLCDVDHAELRRTHRYNFLAKRWERKPDRIAWEPVDALVTRMRRNLARAEAHQATGAYAIEMARRAHTLDVHAEEDGRVERSEQLYERTLGWEAIVAVVTGVDSGALDAWEARMRGPGRAYRTAEAFDEDGLGWATPKPAK